MKTGLLPRETVPLNDGSIIKTVVLFGQTMLEIDAFAAEPRHAGWIGEIKPTRAE